MKPSLKARLERAGPIRDIDRVRSGSPVDLVLRLGPDLSKVKTITAIESLAKRGITLLRAKRTIEAVVENGEAVVHLPTVEHVTKLARELRSAGFIVSRLASTHVDVRVVREKLGLTQEQFALRFGLDVDAVQNWEQGRYQPDKATLAYLRVIARQPREAAKAQEEELR
jgi:DNA-binding transcriptional regulator YiaG